MGGGLRFGCPGEAADLTAFLGRAVRLEQAAVVRLRAGPGAVTAYVRLPFGVLVSRSARTDEVPDDVTVGAAALLAAVEAAGEDAAVVLPASQDAAWRGQLPPVAGWQQLDRVPAGAVAQLVRAAAATLKSLGARPASGLGESLLDHEALTVAGAGRTVVIPLRVLSAVWRMGFLGDITLGPVDEAVVVSATGSWVRLAAPYGSAYHHISQGLLVRPR
jgi:hypothetical protein